jgi:hypothetical protein
MEQLESADAIVLSPAGDESVRELLMSVNPGAQLLAPQNWLSIIGTSAERKEEQVKHASWLQYVSRRPENDHRVFGWLVQSGLACTTHALILCPLTLPHAPNRPRVGCAGWLKRTSSQGERQPRLETRAR